MNWVLLISITTAVSTLIYCMYTNFNTRSVRLVGQINSNTQIQMYKQTENTIILPYYNNIVKSEFLSDIYNGLGTNNNGYDCSTNETVIKIVEAFLNTDMFDLWNRMTIIDDKNNIIVRIYNMHPHPETCILSDYVIPAQSSCYRKLNDKVEIRTDIITYRSQPKSARKK